MYCRVLLWPSSWVQRLTWNAQRSPQRKASTVCSAPQPWPASTSCNPSRRPAPPAVSPKDFSTFPASRICSLLPWKRRRPRAVLSCEWGPPGLHSPYDPKPPASLVSGKGGWAWFYQGFLLNPSLHPPGNQTPLRRGGHHAVHLLLNLLAHICLFPLPFILLLNKQYQSRVDNQAFHL